MIDGRILVHQNASGTANMAIDEALLEAVASEPSFAYLRTYEWLEPTLSLGYFQKMTDAEADPRFHSQPIVRRATGGGALWHDREITYSVIVPANHPLARQAQTLYRVIHEAIGRLIRERGLAVSRRGGPQRPAPNPGIGGNRAAESERPFLCFADRDPEDLVLDQVKLVGSAQRRRAGAVLQHGSILLNGSRVTPELAGLSDLLSGADPGTPSSWSGPVTDAIAEALGLRSKIVEIPEPVQHRARELEFSIYSNPEWTRRR